MAKLRLLKVICQPVFVIDDGEDLMEQVADPIVVSAAEWPTYPTTRFAQGFEALRSEVEGPNVVGLNVVQADEADEESPKAADSSG